MNAFHYFTETLDLLPSLTVEQAVLRLKPLNGIANIAAVSSIASLRHQLDNGQAILSSMSDKINWVKAEESFAPLAALKGALGTIIKGSTAAATTVTTITILNDKDRMKGIAAELSQLTKPSNLLPKEYPLALGKAYPIAKQVITFDEIEKLLSNHITAVKILHGFINSSKFHATTLPKLDDVAWLAPLKSLHGNDSKTAISTDILFGNVVVETTLDKKSDTWVTKKIAKQPVVYPTKFSIPRPFNLVSHMKLARAHLDAIWAIDTDMSRSIAEVYSVIDKMHPSKAGKEMRSTLGMYYTHILAAAMDLAMAYSKLVEFAVRQYGIK